MLINRVELSRSELRAEVSLKRLDEKMDASSGDACLVGFPPFIVVAPLRLRRRGPELRIVLQGAAAPRPKPDPLLLRTLIEARAWLADYLDSRQGLTVSAIARRAGANVGDVSRSLQLGFLAPDLLEAILDGTQPVALTAERLKRAGELPLLWNEQRAKLGVDDLETGALSRRSGACTKPDGASWRSSGQADPWINAQCTARRSA